MRKPFVSLTMMAVSCLCAEERVSTLQDQRELAVTVYNDSLALVKDVREVTLPKGELALAFQEVASQIQPETALLTNLTHPKQFWVVEQNFDFDLLSPEKLLEKYVGQKVVVVKSQPNANGPGAKEMREEATVLATNGGLVLQYADRIETSLAGRLVYPNVPSTLRSRPTLVVTLNSGEAKAQTLALSYLTQGLRWQADYVGQLAGDEKHLDLSGWVTLTNQSGTSYPSATLQLAAGDVNRVRRGHTKGLGEELQRMALSAAPTMKEEALFEYHLYTLDRPVTLKENQTKQVALLSTKHVPVRKEYRIENTFYPHTAGTASVKVLLEMDNRSDNGLGMPLPKGTLRLYKEDSQNRMQFIGEDAINHTPKNETVRLQLGNAFDITSRFKHTDHKELGKNEHKQRLYESTLEMDIKNAKKESVQVNVLESLPGEWEILEKSHAFIKENSSTAQFKVDVPAEGSTKLTYRVRVRE